MGRREITQCPKKGPKNILIIEKISRSLDESLIIQ